MLEASLAFVLKIERHLVANGVQVAIDARLVLFIKLHYLSIGRWTNLVADFRTNDLFWSNLAFLRLVEQQQVVDELVGLFLRERVSVEAELVDDRFESLFNGP